MLFFMKSICLIHLMMITIEDKIKVKVLEISSETDSERKQELQRQLQKLQLKQEIERITKRIEQLG